MTGLKSQTQSDGNQTYRLSPEAPLQGKLSWTIQVFFFFFLIFLGLNPQHVEVLRLAVESEL